VEGAKGQQEDNFTSSSLLKLVIDVLVSQPSGFQTYYSCRVDCIADRRLIAGFPSAIGVKMATNNSFEFVLHEPVKGISKVTQTKIRRQAMKAVAAARRQAGQYGKHNLRQSAVSFAQTDLDLSPTAVPIRIRDTRGAAVHKRSIAATDGGVEGRDQIPNQANARPAADRQTDITLYSLTSPVPLTGIELFMKHYSVRPADLSALTSIRMAPVAAQAFTTDPRTLKDLLSCRQWSYFEYLYARYGHSPCLDDAIRCLIVASQAVLAPSSKTSNAAVLSHYGTALKSLQKAINDPTRWSDPDTLCAANMLQLFDVSPSCPCLSGWGILTAISSAPELWHCNHVVTAYIRGNAASGAQGPEELQN
jgi:hypothetical protein